MARVVQEAHAARAAGEVRLSSPLPLSYPVWSLIISRALSSPSRRTCLRRPKSPHGRRTSHMTRASRLCTRCGTRCSTSCARSPIRLPSLPLVAPFLYPQLRHRRFHRPCRYQHQRPLLTVRARAQAQLLRRQQQSRMANITSLLRAHSSQLTSHA